MDQCELCMELEFISEFKSISFGFLETEVCSKCYHEYEITDKHGITHTKCYKCHGFYGGNINYGLYRQLKKDGRDFTNYTGVIDSFYKITDDKTQTSVLICEICANGETSCYTKEVLIDAGYLTYDIEL